MHKAKILLGSMSKRDYYETQDFLARVLQDEIEAGRGEGAVDRINTAIADWSHWFDCRTPKHFSGNLAGVLRGDAVGKKAAPRPATNGKGAWQAQEPTRAAHEYYVPPPPIPAADRMDVDDAAIAEMHHPRTPEELDAIRTAALAKRGGAPVQIRPSAKHRPALGPNEAGRGMRFAGDVAADLAAGYAPPTAEAGTGAHETPDPVSSHAQEPQIEPRATSAVLTRPIIT
jgi:hypothetical protein